MSCEDWKKVKLSEIVDIFGGGTPKTSVEEYWGGDIPWLSIKDFNNDFRKVYDTEKKITIQGLENSNTSILNTGDIIISARGTVGELAQLAKPMAFNQSCYGLRAKKTTTNDYVYYLLKNVVRLLKNSAHGSVFDTITRKTFDIIKIKIPKLKEQEKIAHILSSIDDKIELNHQINQDLEEMAQAIFKSWFVDFEPFRDGEFVDSELGPIPKGWEVKNFGSLIETLIGGDWGKSEPEKNHNQQVYCIRGADIPEINLGQDEKVPIRYILKKNLQKKISVEGDLIVEISGGSPIQSTGRVAIVTKDLIERFSNKLICTNFCRLIRPKNDKFSYFIYYYWKYLYAKDVFFIYENGTTGIKNLDIYGFLKTFKIIVPPVEKVQEFNALIKDKLSFIQKNGEQNQILSNLRDTLLPKLMSGEIRV